MSTEQGVGNPFPSGIERDLESARVLIEDQPWSDNPQKYRKAAEAIIRRILIFDPENEYAKVLLAKAQAPVPSVTVPSAPATAPVPSAPPAPAAPAPAVPKTPASCASQIRQVTPVPPRRPREDNLAFTALPPKPKPKEPEKKTPGGKLTGFMALLAIAGLLILIFQSTRSKSDYAPRAVAASSSRIVQVRADAGKATVFEATAETPRVRFTPSAPAALPAPSAPGPQLRLAAATAPPPPPQPTTIAVKSSSPVVAPVQTGTLAVSSPTTVDIYLGDQLVGSAPTTLELPAGSQKLEYRHQDMRKTVIHTIKANETTTVMITFDVPVQINARPWAQVFIDGSQRQPLGQTPLSDVRVPIGSVLVFENPNFPAKRYRVTGAESEIRVTFP